MTRLPATRTGASELVTPEIRIEIPEELQEILKHYPHLLRMLRYLLDLKRSGFNDAEQLLLLLILVDDSGSIHDLRAEKLLVAAVNAYVAAQRGNTLCSVWVLNRKRPLIDSMPRPIVPSVPDFRASGHTPMHDRFPVALVFQVAQYLIYRAKHKANPETFKRIVTATGLVGDGIDSGSHCDADVSRRIVNWMLAQDGVHQIWARGVGDDDFYEAFGAMGIRDIGVIDSMLQMEEALGIQGRRTDQRAVEAGRRALRRGSS